MSYTATFHYGSDMSTYEGTAEYVVSTAMVNEAYYQPVLDELKRTGYSEWGWWTFTKNQH